MMLRKISLLLLVITIALTITSCSTKRGEYKEFIPPAFPPPPDKARFIYERTFKSTYDVKELSALDKLKQFATGAGGVGIGLSKPYGVAVYKGRVFITDTVSRHLLMLDAPGKDYVKIGTDGPGSLVKPIGVSVDPVNELVYVADNTAKRVVAFNMKGEFVSAYGGRDILSRPTGVTISKDGEKVFVVDVGGVDSPSHKVYVFDRKSGNLIQSIGQRGKQNGEFNLPLQAATAPDGSIYVVDGGNFRVQVFDEEGNYLKTFGGIGTRTGQFSRPKGIAIGPKGFVYVVDTGFGNFQVFNPKGELMTFVGSKGKRGVPGEFLLPAGIAVDEDGRVYVADQFFKKIEVYRPADLKSSDGWLSSTRAKK